MSGLMLKWLGWAKLCNRVECYEATRRLRRIEMQLELLVKQGESIMAISKGLQDALARIDAATNAIAERISAAAAQVKPGMTDAEVTSVVTQLDAESAKLNSIAADPVNPVPAAPTFGPGPLLESPGPEPFDPPQS